MQKRILIVLFVFISFFCYPIHANCEKLEMIVLMDTSISTLPIYDFLEGYLVRGILEGHLKPGDSFHLLSFSNTPDIEISREIREEKDKENIIKYIDILQPMGKYTDLIMALKYLYTFTMDLPLNNKKSILILTDGIHDPPPGSPYFFDDKQLINSELEKISQLIRRQGWDVHLLEIPGKYREETSVKTSYLSMLSENLGIPFNKYDEEKKDNISNIALGVPSIEFPEHLGEVGYRFKAPFKIVNFN